jgi:hypothetical protein
MNPRRCSIIGVRGGIVSVCLHYTETPALCSTGINLHHRGCP